MRLATTAYLTTKLGKKQCSAFGLEFPLDSKPSISRAFAAHVREAHRPRTETLTAKGPKPSVPI